MRKIVKTVSTIDEFDPNLFTKLNIGVEIQDFTEPNLSMREMARIMFLYKKKLKTFKNIRALHGPFLDLNPASPDRKIREISQQRYLNVLYIAKELKVDYLIFHSQINPFINHPKLVDLNNRQAKRAWIDILRKSKYEGIILIENIFETDPNMLKKYIDTIDNPQIKVNLDIGHSNISGKDLKFWIKILDDRIYYMHIHSNDGKYDTHNKLRKEDVLDLYSILKNSRIDPILSLEYETSNLEEEIKKYRID